MWKAADWVDSVCSIFNYLNQYTISIFDFFLSKPIHNFSFWFSIVNQQFSNLYQHPKDVYSIAQQNLKLSVNIGILNFPESLSYILTSKVPHNPLSWKGTMFTSLIGWTFLCSRVVKSQREEDISLWHKWYVIVGWVTNHLVLESMPALTYKKGIRNISLFFEPKAETVWKMTEAYFSTCTSSFKDPVCRCLHHLWRCDSKTVANTAGTKLKFLSLVKTRTYWKGEQLAETENTSFQT